MNKTKQKIHKQSQHLKNREWKTNEFSRKITAVNWIIWSRTVLLCMVYLCFFFFFVHALSIHMNQLIKVQSLYACKQNTESKKKEKNTNKNNESHSINWNNLWGAMAMIEMFWRQEYSAPVFISQSDSFSLLLVPFACSVDCSFVFIHFSFGLNYLNWIKFSVVRVVSWRVMRH